MFGRACRAELRLDFIAKSSRRPRYATYSLSGQWARPLLPLANVTSSRQSATTTAFVDTHCHLDLILPRLAKERRRAARNAEAAGQPVPPPADSSFEAWRATLEGPERGFEGCVTVGCQAHSLDTVASLLAHQGVHGAFGIHPLNAHDWSDEVENKLSRLMALRKVVAWGECGLDYFDKKTRGQIRDADVRDLQRRVFSRQLELSVSLEMPLVVHTRHAEEDTLELMAKHLPASHPVHVHCFTSSLGMAKELLARFPRLYIGFTGVVTFKNAREVQEVVKHTPLERLLLETDGPYMAPEPWRGHVAHPGHVAYVAQGIARAKGLECEEVLRVCRENARQMYGF